MEACNTISWPLHAGFAEALRLLPLLPFLDAIRRNLIDMVNLRNADLSLFDLIVSVPEFIASTTFLFLGIAMFFIRWQTVKAASLVFTGILLQFMAELKEYQKPESEFLVLDYLNLFVIVAGSICIASGLLTHKTDRDIKIGRWGYVGIILVAILLFAGNEEHYYLAWHLPFYISLLSFAHLASVPQWIAYDATTRSISIIARRQRIRVLLMCLSLPLIPAVLLFFLSHNELPIEISLYRVMPLFLLPIGAIYCRHISTVCMIAFIGWMGDLLSRLYSQDITLQVAMENVALMSSFLICQDYASQAEALLPSYTTCNQ